MIKNEEALANILGRVFEVYANRVQNGLVAPYRALLTANSVDVVFTVTENGIVNVKPLVQEVPQKQEAETQPPETITAALQEPEAPQEPEKSKRRKKTEE